MSRQPQPASPAKYLLRDMDAAAKEFYRRLAEDRILATTRCDRCNQTMFPPRTQCPRCGQATTWTTLPRRGRLHAFTTQETALRFTAPTVLALLEVEDVVLPGICSTPYSELRIEQEMTIDLIEEAETGLSLLCFET